MKHKNGMIGTEAACKILGVCSMTLYNWEKKGKIKESIKHPINGYKMYDKEYIESLVRETRNGGIKNT